ncbi:hypothetical protein CsSME_00010997 [Camellia sinensis var. sinensis]
MEEYLAKIKEISNQLQLASSMIDDEDLVLITLNGLPDAYDALKTAICARAEILLMVFEVEDIEEVDQIDFTKEDLEEPVLVPQILLLLVISLFFIL